MTYEMEVTSCPKCLEFRNSTIELLPSAWDGLKLPNKKDTHQTRLGGGISKKMLGGAWEPYGVVSAVCVCYPLSILLHLPRRMSPRC